LTPRIPRAAAYKKGYREGRWTYWHEDGSIDHRMSGIYKHDGKIAELPDKKAGKK